MIARLHPLRRPLVALLVLAVLGGVTSGNAFWLRVATSACIYFILIASFNIVYGYAGLLSLFHAALYGCGAYTAAILGAELGWSFWATLPLAMLAAFVAAMLVALPTARLGGIFLAIATLGAGVAAEQIFQKATITGGVNGLGDIVPPGLFGHELRGGTFPYFALAAIFALATFEILARTTQSRLGRRFVALRESRLDTQSVGINPFRTRLAAFGISAVFAGLAGTLFAHLERFISPTAFSLHEMIEVLIVAMLGGAGTVAGPVVGVVVLVGLEELGHRVLDLTVVLGAGVVLLNIYAPKGLGGYLRGRIPRRWQARPALPTGAQLAAVEPLAAGHGDHRLQVCEVDVAFQGVLALSKVNLELHSGQVLGLIGPNGAGKTTCVNVISGHVTPTAGAVELDGEPLVGLAPHEVARRGVVRTFQTTRLVPSFDLLTNVTMGRDRFGKASLASQLLHLGRSAHDDEEARLAALSLLETLGIAEHAFALTGQVSYGIRRRAEIAKALAVDPVFLLLDEPGAGLSEFERHEVATAIKAVAAVGVGVLVIDHNIGFVTAVCDEITVLAAGEVLASGTAQDVLADQAVIAAYLGRAEAEALQA